MKLSKTKPPAQLAFNMTPMIDIVFLLIIFFMTVSQITPTIDVPMPLPRVIDGGAKAVTASITINLDREGSIVINSQQLSMNKALASIQSKLLASGDDPNRIKIQIRCDRNCESRHVSELLENLATMGFTNVRSAVTDK